jgi:hypothetical protein
VTPAGEAEALLLLREIRDLLREQRRVPRDGRHVALLAAIAEEAAETVWSARELVDHARVSEPLRSALLAACGALNARKTGKLLARLEGVDLAGLLVERIGADGSGIVWTVRKLKKPVLAIA